MRLFALQKMKVEKPLKSSWYSLQGQDPSLLGFSPTPVLHFGHPDQIALDDHRRGYPIVNTCGNVLRLPVVSSYDVFKTNMINAGRESVCMFSNY